MLEGRIKFTALSRFRFVLTEFSVTLVGPALHWIGPIEILYL